MPKHPAPPLYALLIVQGWSQPEIDVVRAGVRGQVSEVLTATDFSSVDEATFEKLKTARLLVVTAPVACSAYSVGAMLRAASPATRVVRAYGPEGEASAAALWLNAADTASALDLDWRRDSDRLPANEANVRIWLRADEVGISACPATFSRPRYIADGVRAQLARGVALVRGQLGQFKRSAYLAKQRRSMRQK